MNDSKNFSPSPTACLAIDGSKIKSIREMKKLTQLYVATCLGVTVDTISRWENGRSPNIKFENAEKLAEVLEISLSDIEDKTGKEAYQIPTPEPTAPALASQRLKSWWPLLPVGLLLILTYFQFSAPHDTTPQLSAVRLLPQHASAHQPFPVLIKVQATSPLPLSFIVKEFLPPGCQVLASQPALVASQQAREAIKWLSSAEDDTPLFFAYLARTAPDLAEGEQLLFQGEVMVQGQQTRRLAITGNNTLAITNFHWADSNQDQRIDDAEILTIFNSFAALQALGVDIDEIRQIWAGQGYRWDSDAAKFVVVP
ncbi:MAG: helix-turn-helix domain-containing protein [Proteobacteria bacterium]|nr:helix-turn-helix domain-containing protein [Pseudomonadota bacterium]MBU1639372.1 helix-turn-helix domain-containing protein [Pseudomonadota bacterium]